MSLYPRDDDHDARQEAMAARTFQRAIERAQRQGEPAPDAEDGVRLCATPHAALDAWDADPQCTIVVNADATLYAVGHEQAVAYWYPCWHLTSPEELEDVVEEERTRLTRR